MLINMKHQSRITMFLQNLLMLVTILLIHSTIWTASEEVENEIEFDYKKGSEKGPSHWGDLKKGWEKCKTGKMQSPIDLSSERVTVVPKLGELKRCYKPQNASVKNRGHDIEVEWKGDAGSIHINGAEFFLKQCHWHSPSEHTINGKKYDLELHMVHESSNGKSKFAVVGLLYRIGQPDPTLSKLSKYIKSLVDEDIDKKKSIGVFDPSEIKLGGNKYYRYTGSLTTPPCTEGVIWTINKKIRSASRTQVKLLREAVHDYAEKNARPVQPLNRRGIQLYIPKRKE